MTRERCGWCMKDELYMRYHDEEWGAPLHDDQMLFEFLMLETMQAGLSWHTVLKKRDNFRAAYRNFNVDVVAAFGEREIEDLMRNAGIIRNRAKIEASVRNARAFRDVQQAFGSFDAYVWGFVDGRPIVNTWTELKQLPASSTVSDALSKDLKQRGFGFVGSTVVYAHMQATGMVNDHLVSCYRYHELCA